MVIGIYCGESKPELQAFVTPFVEEMKIVLANGIEINDQIVTTKIRCFICDSPARAFIKGDTNILIYVCFNTHNSHIV